MLKLKKRNIYFFCNLGNSIPIYFKNQIFFPKLFFDTGTPLIINIVVKFAPEAQLNLLLAEKPNIYIKKGFLRLSLQATGFSD